MLTTLPDDASLSRARDGDLEMLARGVDFQLLCLAGHLRRSHAVREHLTILRDAGADVRLAPTLPARLMIFDNRTALLPQDPANTAQGALVVHQSGLVGIAQSLFELAWDQARELSDENHSPAQGWEPTDLEREVIRLLSLGNKDEAIGRRVGMSLRSVRRIISNVSDELDAASRFELGVKCTQRGLLPSPAGLDEVGTT